MRTPPRHSADSPAYGPEELLAVLAAVREELLAEATRIVNRIHVYLPLLEPGYKHLLPDLGAKDGVAASVDSVTANRTRWCIARR